jgi:hypothetical protein
MDTKEHAVAKYPVLQGSAPSPGWRRLGRVYTASTASALALLIVTAAPNGANGRTDTTPTAPPAVQAIAASGSSKGAPLFVAADPDLVAKEGVAQDSWFVVSHLTSGSNRPDLLVHYIRLTQPSGSVIQAMVSVLDPVSGKSIAEEKDYKASETTFSTASLDVQTPAGGLSGHASAMHVIGRFQRTNVDLTLAQQGPLLANLGTGILPFCGDINYEYALPSVKTSGSVVVDGKSYQVAGASWFDRQWRGGQAVGRSPVLRRGCRGGDFGNADCCDDAATLASALLVLVKPRTHRTPRLAQSALARAAMSRCVE